MKIFKVVLILLCSQALANQEVNISYAKNSDVEKEKGKQVLRLIDKYQLKKWWFTDDIYIDESTRSPFSHPILTLPVSRPTDDLSGLSQLIHEQIHWFENSKRKEVENTILELKQIYPEVPVGYPDGARNELSSYLHLAVCLMELDALSELLGKEKAESIIKNNGKYFYKWIYKTVLQDQDKIRALLIKNALYI